MWTKLRFFFYLHVGIFGGRGFVFVCLGFFFETSKQIFKWSFINIDILHSSIMTVILEMLNHDRF